MNVFRWLLVCVIICGSVGCSIEKRHFNGGYYIKWHKRYKKTEVEPIVQKPVDTVSTVFVPDTIPIEIKETEPVEFDTVSSADQKVKHEKLAPLPREERKFEPLGVLAFKILLLEIPVSYFLDNVNVNDMKRESRLGFLFLTIAIVVFILAVVSMIRYFRDPKHYRFNIFAIVVILVSLGLFLVLVLADFAIHMKYFLPKYW